MRNISFGAFLGNVLAYMLLVAFVTVSLYTAFVLGETVMQVHFFDTKVDPIIFLIPLALFGIWTQRNLSAASGFGRFVDFVVTLSMVLVVALACLLWADVPAIQEIVTTRLSEFGVTISTEPSVYKLAVVLVFGLPGVANLLGRDILGIGRRSQVSNAAPSGIGTAAGSVVTTGHINQPPHTSIPLGSESGNPFFRTKGDLLVEIPDRVHIQMPNGRTFIIPMTERLADRMEWNLGRRALPGPADGADADADAGDAGAGDAGAGGGGDGH